jgi:flavin-dependent dehydrogenase
VVGARCAGSATALLLARKGYQVLLVDRATFPSDTISGHCLFHRATVRLQRWGLLDKVLASNCPPITHIAANLGDFTLTGGVPFIEDAPVALAPRRTVLDTILVEAAVQAGVELREGFSVDQLVHDGERVVGIRGYLKDSGSIVERAQIVIGADGKRSKIAQLVQAPTYLEVPSLTFWYYSYWSGVPTDGLSINFVQQHIILSLPTNDGLTLVVVGAPHSQFGAFRGDIEGNFMKALTLLPALADGVRQGHREERYYGMADVPNFFRKPYGAGWALVGDAGHHKDPTPAYGISDAFCDAELLSEAVDQGLNGTLALDEAGAQYEQARNTRAIPDHEYTCRISQFQFPPEVFALRAALRGNEDDTRRYLATLATAIRREQFYAPQNIQRIMMQAAMQPQ